MTRVSRASNGSTGGRRRATNSGARLLPVLFDGFAARYGAILDDAVLEVGRRLMPVIGSYLHQQPRPWTVQHADYRLDNLMFGTAGGRSPVGRGRLADGGPRAGRGRRVVLPRERALRWTTGVGTKSDWSVSITTRLVAGGVDDYSFDDCFADYRRYAYAGYLMAVGASMMVERTERGDEMFLTMARRHAAQIDDLRSLRCDRHPD